MAHDSRPESVVREIRRKTRRRAGNELTRICDGLVVGAGGGTTDPGGVLKSVYEHRRVESPDRTGIVWERWSTITGGGIERGGQR